MKEIIYSVIADSFNVSLAAEIFIRIEGHPKNQFLIAHTKIFKIENYFQSIEVIREKFDSVEFKIIFHVKDDVDNYWKDIVADILLKLSKIDNYIKIEALK